jgi:hypothetical protein
VRRVVSLDGYCGTPAEPRDYPAQCAHCAYFGIIISNINAQIA